MTQQPILYFGIGNISPTACQLEKAPEFRFLGQSGQELPISAAPTWDGIYGKPVLLLPGLGEINPVNDPQVGQASLTFTYSTATCHGPDFTPPPAVVGITIVLPNAQGIVPVDMGGGGLDPCHDSVGVVYQPVR